MEFKSLKNIESSFRQIRMIAMVFLVLCVLVAGYSIWSSYSFAEKQREKIYVLDNGKSLMMALSQRPFPKQTGRGKGTREAFSRTVLYPFTG